MSTRSRAAAITTLRWTASATVALAVAACGHAIAPGIPFQHSPRFDFRRPPCTAATATAPAPAASVLVRYLGAGGLYIGWQGEALLISPFFSNPGLFASGFGRLRPDLEVIEKALRDLPAERVGAILVGHAHYDHLGDVPAIAGEFASRARLYLNRAGANALEPFGELRTRQTVLEDIEQRPTLVTDAGGRPMPYRMTAVPSGHAPHFGPFTLWTGDIEKSERPWAERRHGSLKAGQPYSFAIDLLEFADERAPVRFRIYLQDAAVREPLGWPAPLRPDEARYDLVVVCVASAHRVEPYPEGLLRRTAPRHVLAIHYENFFQPWGPGHGFVPLLTRGRADRFLRRVAATLDSIGGELVAPRGAVCGPSAPGWTMPLVGEVLTFSSSMD
jgi:hypothetical protein